MTFINTEPFLILAQSDGSSLWTLVAFGVILILLLVILIRGNPRSQPIVVKEQSPQEWTDDSTYAINRKRAAAAAFAFHLHSTRKDTPNEKN